MSTPEQQLAALRTRIDAMDETLSRLLIERCGIIHEVRTLKDQHWPSPCHIRPAREGQMHHAIAKRFAGQDIPPAAAIAIWRQLIGASTQLESKLNTTSLAHFPHHAWLAREYFGVEVGVRSEASIADMLDGMANTGCNLAILPSPGSEGGDWWRDAALFIGHGLFIFASLPATNQPLPNGAAPALALGKLSPEPSGDDISYFAIATADAVSEAELNAILPAHVISADARHHLLLIDGFVTADAPALAGLKKALGAGLLSITYLGAHPRIVSL